MRDPRDGQLTLDQAYQATYLWLDHVGDPPVDILEPAHGSVELRTEKAFVRVRSSEGPVEQSSVLALLRAAEAGKTLLLFSPSGFSPGALSIAETQGIALFTLDPHGRAIPETTHARMISPENEPDPPFAPDPVDEEESFWSYIPPPRTDGSPATDEEGIDAGTSDWADCPACGSTHYRNARFCKACGTKLQTDTHEVHAQMRCRNCGSHDIEKLE
ncbi:MAG: zinc ribbon domain-containing protein [Acidimicrobiia bacterium]